jgi:hypothetical protein
MNMHLSQEDLILAYYRELDSRPHLDGCAECRDELARLSRVLDQVTPVEVAEPDADYEARVWDRLSWRLRGEKRRDRNAWMKWAAAAAVAALAFLAGLLITNHNKVTDPARIIAGNPQQPGQPAQQGTPATTVAQRGTAGGTGTVAAPNGITTSTAGTTTQQQRDRILLVVVGDHFDESERMLVELTNITPGSSDTDISNERERAEELLASNRLYRRTARDRGEDNVATLLDELEPVLMQLAHAPSSVSAEELQSMQKRIETKGLVFKLRVLRADARATTQRRNPNPQPSI